MPTQLELAQKADAQFEIQGTVWSGRLLAIGRYCSVRQIRQMVSAPTRQLMERPPARTDWVPGAAMVELDAAIYDLVGAEVCSICSSITSEVDTLRAARIKFAGTLLKAFGTSPHTILQNMNQLAKDVVRGMTYLYHASGERNGAMRVTYADSSQLPLSTFVAAGGGFRAVFAFTRFEGTISEPDIVTNGRQNTAEFALHW